VAVKSRATVNRLGAAFLASVASCALFIYPVASVRAQDAGIMSPSLSDDAKLYLSSDKVVYDRDNDKVTASGAVRINYGGYKLVAGRVTYDQKSGRLIAEDKIELVEPDGNRVYADKMDITDDFGQGFVNSLRVETTDDTHIAAESGERVNADVFILRNGVYTACSSCAEHPERAPLWQVKAKKVIEDGKSHSIRLESTQFELFGMPIAYLPVMVVPDHTVKRKSGFLFPTWTTTQNLGFGVTTPYYYVFNPSADVTVKPTYYSKQGFMLEADFRKRFHNGLVTVTAAGISQASQSSFSAGTTDAVVRQRGAIATTGTFNINPRWTFGWDVLLQSDNNFARTYSLTGQNASTKTNQVYLTGLGKRNYFDLRAYYFDVQDADQTNTAEFKQAFVHPVLDYHYVAPQPVMGGELTADFNFTNLTHRFFDVYSLGTTNRFRGVRGETSRVTGEVEWRRQFTTQSGLLLTPMLAARGDAFQLSLQNIASSGYTYNGSLYSGSAATRTMLTAGLEARYPFLITLPGSNHVIEPIAQIYVRPNEQLAGRLPNEDAQSFVFDASNLFERDKFSGYDRVEGGTRANIGVRYTGTFDNGYTVHGIAGQSFQIGGLNSFATNDLVYAGANSGLDKKASDYVGLVGLETPFGVGLTESARFDRETLKLARLDSTLTVKNKFVTTNVTYTKVAAQPAYGLAKDSDEIAVSAVLPVSKYWKLYGSITWNFTDKLIAADSAGFRYDDECTVLAIGISQSRDINNTAANDWAIGARLSFRTLGDIEVGNTSASAL
jgi:LPS-assembly protein